MADTAGRDEPDEHGRRIPPAAASELDIHAGVDRRPDRQMTADSEVGAALPETLRLSLRELTSADVDDLHVALGDPYSMRFYPHPLSREEVLRWIEWSRRSYQTYGHGLWGMVLKATGELVGDCGLVVQDVDGEQLLEVGYHVKPSHQRRGLATEAARVCADHAFQSVGVGRLIALVRVDNEPSAGVARKVGMTVWKEMMRAGVRHHVYSMTRREWRDRVPYPESSCGCRSCSPGR
jgi:RimJ/RimL family protein N-acetyltransferase